MLHFVDIKISKKYNNTDMKNLNLLSYRQTDTLALEAVFHFINYTL